MKSRGIYFSKVNTFPLHTRNGIDEQHFSVFREVNSARSCLKNLLKSLHPGKPKIIHLMVTYKVTNPVGWKLGHCLDS